MWLKLLVRVWAAPYSALGLALGLLVMTFGGHARARQGALEFGGGRLGLLVSHAPPRFAYLAISLGHVIVAVDLATLDDVREHEHVHVKQYERWGPLFGPAYLLSSLAQLVRGGRPYLDNRFEREAYDKAGSPRRG